MKSPSANKIISRPSGLVVGKTEPAELPAVRRIEEITVGHARMPGRSGKRTAAQDHLIDHEFAIVFAERAHSGPKAGIGRIGATRPLPHDAERIVDNVVTGCGLPFGFSRQVFAGPAGERVRLVVADVTDGRVGIDRPQAPERHLMPCAVDLLPIAGGAPTLGLKRVPT